jgi:hypothetical protein
MMCVHVPNANKRVSNILIAIRDGGIPAQYRNLQRTDRQRLVRESM